MNITPLDDSVFVAPQLGREHLALLRDAGFRCIVNNRPDGEELGQPSSAELRIEAQRLGLDYRHIPIAPGRMSEADAVAFAEVMRQTGGPILAFCRSGTRSANLWKRGKQLIEEG